MSRVSDLSVELVPVTAGSDIEHSSLPRSCGVERVGKFLFAAGWLGQGHYKTSRRIPVVGLLDINARFWRWIRYEGSLMHEPGVFLYDDFIYLFRQKARNGRGTLFRFDLGLEELSECDTTGISPAVRIHFSANYIEDIRRFVVYGGSTPNGEIDPDVHVLAMPDLRWIKPVVKGKPPQERAMHCACVHGRAIYYVGGIGPGTTGLRQDGVFMLTISQYDVATWAAVQTGVTSEMLFIRASLVSFRGKLLICGGEFDPGEYGGITSYDPKTRVIKKVISSPSESRMFGYGGRAFQIKKDHSFGIFGGNGETTNFVLVTAK